MSADAHHITQPRPDGAGALLAMQRALHDSGVAADEIDYVNAHGTATPLNDVVGDARAQSPAWSACLPCPGQLDQVDGWPLSGAAGAIEALACVLALGGGFIPPTVNLEHPDPECDLDYVPKRSRAQSIRTALSNSYGFGGNNTSVVLRAWG